MDEQSGDYAEKVEENENHLEETVVEIVTTEDVTAAEADNEITDFVCDICDAKFHICITYTFVRDFHKENVDYTLKEILSNEKVGDQFSADRLFSVLVELQDDQRFSWPEMLVDQAVVFKQVQKQ